MPSTAHVRTHNNNNNNNNNMSFDRGGRIFSLTCTGKHGIMSLYLVIILLSAAIPWAAAQPGSNNNNSDPYQYSRFTPSMAIIIAVLITALFFMGFFSVYIRQCSEAQSANPNTVRGRGMSRRGAAARGLDASVIETFPTLVYSVVKGLKIGKSALECAVCLSEFEDHETLRLIPKCDHVFHPECIDEWLSSHTTCPVCRANLVPQPGDSVPTLTELHPECSDVEAQNYVLDPNHQNVEHEQGGEREEHETLDVNQTLKRNRTRGSRSGRARIFQLQLPFPRSHSTGHSLVQPGENTERFTLRLPVEVRKKIMNQKLNRAMSMVVLPREGSSRQGYRTGGEGSGRGKSHMRFEKSDRAGKSDRWVFSMTPPFFMRESSFKLQKVAANDGEGTSAQPVRPEGSTSNSVRPPV